MDKYRGTLRSGSSAEVDPVTRADSHVAYDSQRRPRGRGSNNRGYQNGSPNRDNGLGGRTDVFA